MALTTPPPRPPRTATCGTRGLIGTLLATVLTALALTALLCGTAMAGQMPAGTAQGRPAPQVSTAAGHGLSMSGVEGRPGCEECVRENSRAHCDSVVPVGVRDDSAHSGPCAVPADGQVAVAAVPVQAATVAVRDSAVSRPPDLHQLQVLRV